MEMKLSALQKKEELNQEALEKSEAQIDDINSRLTVLSNCNL